MYIYSYAHIITSLGPKSRIYLKKTPGPIDFYRINETFMDKTKLDLNLTQVTVTGTNDPSSPLRYYRYLFRT